MIPVSSLAANTIAPTTVCVAIAKVSLLRPARISASAVFPLSAALVHLTALAPEMALLPIRPRLAPAGFASVASLAVESTLAATSTRPASCEPPHVAVVAVATNQVAAFIAAVVL